jgi:hypothetical protein
MNWSAIGEVLMELPEATPAVLEIACGRDESAEVVVRKTQEFFSEQARLRERMQER